MRICNSVNSTRSRNRNGKAVQINHLFPLPTRGWKAASEAWGHSWAESLKKVRARKVKNLDKSLPSMRSNASGILPYGKPSRPEVEESLI